MKKLIFLLFLLPVPFILFAQTANESLLEQYANEKKVILNKKESYSFSVINDQPVAKRKSFEETLIIDPTLESNGTASIVYNDFSRIFDIKGETLMGKKRTKVDLDNDVETNALLSEDIFYSDYKYKTIHFRRLEKGATTSLEYSEQFTRPRMLPSFSIGESAPLLSTELEIVAEKGITLGYKIFNNEDNIITVVMSENENGEKTYSFKAKNIAKMKQERRSQGYAYLTPHIVFYIKGFETSKGYKPFLESDKDLYDWYFSLVKDINKKDETELQTITTELIKDKTTDFDKAETIFNWVQQKIRYIAFEDGMGGFIPREAADICSKRYGDCKDMSNILNQMLSFAGLNSHLVWIGTRSRPYSYSDVPTPLVDNHMIAAIELNNEVIFLDATGKYVPFGYPTSFVQGKEAMVSFGETHKIIKVPIVTADKNVHLDIVELNIEEGVLTGNAEKMLKGYEKMNTLHRFEAYRNEEDKFWNNFLSLGNNKFELGKKQYNFHEYEAEDAEITYDFTIEDYVRTVGSRILLNPHLYKTGLDLIDEERESAFKFQYARTFMTKYIIAIPQGYTVSNLPENSAMQNEELGFDIQYKQTDKTIIVTVSTHVDTLLVEKDKQQAFNDIVTALKKAQKKNIVFTKN